jgi:hypothetical protein
MKNLILSASFVCSILGFVSSASAAATVLNCNESTGNGTMTLTIQGDSAGDTLNADINETKTGLSYSEQGTFEDFEDHGKMAVYSNPETETSVTEDLITGAANKGVVTRHILGFAGGPGEAGWPEQNYSYNCTR